MNKLPRVYSISAPRRLSHIALWLLVPATLSFVGCGDDVPIIPDASPDAPIPDAPPIDATLPACSPSLSFVSPPRYAVPHRLVTLEPTGGSGTYRFELSDGPSGGTIAEVTGAYVAGSVTDVTDVVRVTDIGCVGEAFADIMVVANMQVTPRTVTITPMSSFTFEVLAGSGSFSFEMLETGSGASIDAMTGRYVAGAVEGADRVRVRDLETGDEAITDIQVSTEAGLVPTAAWVVIPQGTRIEQPVTGGSGVYDISIPPGDEAFLSVDGDRLVGVAPGRTTLTLQDRFTGASADIPVRIAGASSDTPFVAGMQDSDVSILSPGDLNGDGFEDLIVGSPLANGTGWRSGVVWVYAGSAGGLGATPAQVINGDVQNIRFGDGFDVGDVDGDGQPDLVVGAWNGTGIRSASGYVDIYPGVAGGFFASAPTHRLHSLRGGDQVGRSVAICDFNGDGFLDIASGAMSIEDFSGTTVPYGQGAVLLYLGSATGFDLSPDQVIWGLADIDGSWQPWSGLQMGRELVAGDFTGDGVCDLVATGMEPLRHLGRRHDGGIFYYRGVAAADGSRGGLETLPYRAIVDHMPTTAGSTLNERNYLGLDIVTGDLNADGRADIVAGQAYTDRVIEGRSLSDMGAVHIFLSPEDSGGFATGYDEAVMAADLTLWGESASDYFGRGIALVDLDGSGTPSLLVSVLGFEDSSLSIPSNAGAVFLYDQGAAGGLDFSFTAMVAGTDPGHNFGTDIGALPDGMNAGLVTYSSQGTSLGHRSGSLEMFAYTPAMGETSAGFADASLLDIEAVASGAEVGFSTAIVGDVTGNGYPDLVVGARRLEPEMPYRIYSWYDHGGVLIYEGAADGFNTASAPTKLIGFDGLRHDDQGGTSVAAIGDFNRDSRPDFLVVARNADRNRSTVDGRDPVARQAACESMGRDNTGAAFVFLGVDSGSTISGPSFVAYGLGSASTNLETAAGGFDYNGDGWDDFVVSTTLTRGSYHGRVILFEGRDQGTLPSGKSVEELCSRQHEWFGDYARQYYGGSLTGIGDVDGDGCDEFAAGIHRYGNETSPTGTQGAVDIHFGWSSAPGSPCATEARTLRLVSGSPSARAGSSVTGGGDVDGDGIPDLVVGAELAQNGAGVSGRAYVVRGAYLRMHAPTNGSSRPIIPLLETAMRGLAVDGPSNGSLFGRATSMVPNLAGDGRAGILIGAPRADILGTTRSGAVMAYRVISRDGEWRIEERPYVLIPGESGNVNTDFGHSVAGSVGPPMAGSHPLIAVGAPYSHAFSIDWGASYAVELSP